MSTTKMDNAEIQDTSRETRTAVAANRGNTYESGSSYQVEGNDTSLPDISGVPDVATREGTRTLRVDQAYILGPTLVEEQRRPRLEISPYVHARGRLDSSYWDELRAPENERRESQF